MFHDVEIYQKIFKNFTSFSFSAKDTLVENQKHKNVSKSRVSETTSIYIDDRLANGVKRSSL